MKEEKKGASRRDFFKSGALAAIPLVVPAAAYGTYASSENGKPAEDRSAEDRKPVNFIYDGPMFSPQDYLEKLNEIDRSDPIRIDYYFNGGVTRDLEEEFARITGKEKAIYLPTGTMANQLAMKLLNGSNTKVLVPENSHIFRDEADAAQSVHNLRLVPLGKDRPYYRLEDLEKEIDYIEMNEVFKSGLGTVVVENPVRRADGTVIPLETIKAISAYGRQKGYKLHLDGARIHIASAYSKVSVAEYASYFDTVYISLYKYLNAGSGAMLCGDAGFIDQIPHQIKILGGTMLRSWSNTAMALHYLHGVDERWEQIAETGTRLISGLNKLEGLRISPVENGSNVFDLELAKEIDLEKLAAFLYTEHRISLRPPETGGIVKFKVNETLLDRDLEELLLAWKAGLDMARQT